MNCSKCGAANDLSAKFCTSCGQKLAHELTCTQCGKSLGVDAKFCDECGASIQAENNKTTISANYNTMATEFGARRNPVVLIIVAVVLFAVLFSVLNIIVGMILWNNPLKEEIGNQWIDPIILISVVLAVVFTSRFRKSPFRIESGTKFAQIAGSNTIPSENVLKRISPPKDLPAVKERNNSLEANRLTYGPVSAKSYFAKKIFINCFIRNNFLHWCFCCNKGD